MGSCLPLARGWRLCIFVVLPHLYGAAWGTDLCHSETIEFEFLVQPPPTTCLHAEQDPGMLSFVTKNELCLLY